MKDCQEVGTQTSSVDDLKAERSTPAAAGREVVCLEPILAPANIEPVDGGGEWDLVAYQE